MEDYLAHSAKRMAVFRMLNELCRTRPLSDIRVADLTGTCGLSRSAFYRLFSGVKDVAVWHMNFCSELGNFQMGRTLTCRQANQVSIGLFTEGADLYGDMFRYWDYDFSLPAASNHIAHMRNTLAERGYVLANETEYELAGIAHSNHQMVAQWFHNHMDVPVDAFVDLLCSFYPPALRAVFDSPPDPQDPLTIVARHIS